MRGEGELTFSDLLRALERGTTFEGIPGLTFRAGDRLADNPAGSTLKSLLGLEDEHRAFARYRALRARERTYL